MGMKSRRKGAGAEREIIDLLQPVVQRAYQQLTADWPMLAPYLEEPRLQRNTLQSDGGGYDILGLPWLAMEVKCQERIQVPLWWAQCLRQAKRGQTPVLVYRRNGAPWRVRMEVAVPVGKHRQQWQPVVEVDLPVWVAYFSLRVYDEAGHRAHYDHQRAQNSQEQPD